MDDHRTDLAFLFPNVLPGFAGVAGFVDAVADFDVAANVGLAGTGVDDIRIGRRDGQRTERRSRLIVGNRLPVNAAVGRFPYSAGGSGGVASKRIARHAGNATNTPARRRPDGAKLQALEWRRIAFGFVAVRCLYTSQCGERRQKEEDTAG